MLVLKCFCDCNQARKVCLSEWFWVTAFYASYCQTLSSGSCGATTKNSRSNIKQPLFIPIDCSRIIETRCMCYFVAFQNDKKSIAIGLLSYLLAKHSQNLHTRELLLQTKHVNLVREKCSCLPNEEKWPFHWTKPTPEKALLLRIECPYLADGWWGGLEWDR